MRAQVIPAPVSMPPAAAAPERRFLHWGQLVVEAGGGPLSTIVGSCVAVCLWDGARQVGGMNHYLLPDAPHVEPPLSKPWSYGELALPELLRQMVAAGAVTCTLVAKVFGGAAITSAEGPGGPGARNAALARSWLAERNIPIVAHDLGGRRGRRLVFDTTTGDVTLRLL